MMNYQRFNARNTEQVPQERNFGSDLHEFMDGLGKIAQILYTSIPTIEFLKIAIKYSWKFCEYLGGNTMNLLGVIKLPENPEVILEALWSKQPAWKSMAKFSSVLALGLIILCLLLSKPSLEEEWNKTPEAPQQRAPEIRSVEDKVYPPEEYEEYQDYPMY